MTRDEKIAILRKLVDNFRANLPTYKSAAYDEANTRVDYIDKFFELLDWDVRNVAGYAEDYRDVVREDRIHIEGKPKAPDYSFRIGNIRKFFVEAKKPSVYIKEEIAPAYQVRRYGYTAKLPLSILTDFEEFAVYDTRIKPDKSDKASVARIFYCTYEEYEKQFEFIEQTFSKPAILKGGFDRYIQDSGNKKGASEVDKEFLKLISHWREELAKNIALRNKDLDIYQLNYAVQKIIDRIVFLRIAEDRGTEEYAELSETLTRKDAYSELNRLFVKGNDKYNSDLFKSDAFLTRLTIDDSTLKSIVSGMYYPDCPYEFSVLPIETLGNIYEQFLGQTIRLTSAHQAKIEEKPEVRKAGGVYYTPQYIVDYIVENTVGEKIKGLTPDAIESIRIVDPACGSGSFLIGAYNYLLNTHIAFYTDEKRIAKSLKDAKIYQVRENDYHLTIAEKQKILLNNIYGVDIDPQAVEVTKLSLLLKLMENETAESAGTLFKHSDLKYLPNLGSNIRCGNSLIGTDFYEEQDMSLFGKEEQRKVNAFDWDREFAQVYALGGFDVVIGNPPYIRQELLADSKEYFKSHYTVFQGTADIYAYFIEKSIRLLKSGGLYGIIVANKWMRANYGTALREYLKDSGIREIIDFGDLPVFEQATTYPCILTVEKGVVRDGFDACVVKNLDFESLSEALEGSRFKVALTTLGADGWSLSDEKTAALLEKLRKSGTPLGEYVGGKIFYGIKTGLNEAFVIDSQTRERLIAEDPKSAEVIKPFLAGRDIKRYREPVSDKFLILFPKGFTNKRIGASKNTWRWLEAEYPAIARHLKPFEESGKKRFDKGDYWWELRACDYYGEFEKPKIILPDISLRGNFSFDSNGGIYCVNTAYIIVSSDLHLLGILNSKLITYIYSKQSSTYRGGYLRFIFQYIEKLPIIPPDDKAKHDRLVALVEQMLTAQKDTAATQDDERMKRQRIEAIDRQIDRIVYELYDLTEEEIRIVEGEKS